MFKGEIDRLSIYALQYGPEVEVLAHPFDDFSLVHTSLRAGAEVECDGQRLWIAEGRTAILSPKKGIRLRWSPGNQQLIVRIPNSLLREAGGDSTAELAPGYLLPGALEAHWELIARSLLNLLSYTDHSAAHAEWAKHLERNLAMFLLLHVPNSSSSSLVQPGASLQASAHQQILKRGPHCMDAVVDYIETHLRGPVALEDLARAASVSERTLNTLCRRHFGTSPMELLRNVRLDAVRSRLLLDPAASITETALEFGFGHLSRFASYYAARYNELPRDTRKHCA